GPCNYRALYALSELDKVQHARVDQRAPDPAVHRRRLRTSRVRGSDLARLPAVYHVLHDRPNYCRLAVELLGYLRSALQFQAVETDHRLDRHRAAHRSNRGYLLHTLDLQAGPTHVRLPLVLCCQHPRMPCADGGHYNRLHPGE